MMRNCNARYLLSCWKEITLELALSNLGLVVHAGIGATCLALVNLNFQTC